MEMVHYPTLRENFYSLGVNHSELVQGTSRELILLPFAGNMSNGIQDKIQEGKLHSVFKPIVWLMFPLNLAAFIVW